MSTVNSGLASKLGKLNMAINMTFLPILNEGNISLPQLSLLSALADEPFLTMTDVSKKMGHSTAAATGLVDRLEKLGYVQRLHAQDDRRKVMVQLTKRGHEIMSKYDDAIQAQLKPDTMLNKLCTELFGQPATLAAA